MHLNMSSQQPKKKTAHSQRTNQYQATDSKINMPNTKADYLGLGLGSLVSNSEGGRLAPLPSGEGWLVYGLVSGAGGDGTPLFSSSTSITSRGGGARGIVATSNVLFNNVILDYFGFGFRSLLLPTLCPVLIVCPLRPLHQTLEPHLCLLYLVFLLLQLSFLFLLFVCPMLLVLCPLELLLAVPLGPLQYLPRLL